MIVIIIVAFICLICGYTIAALLFVAKEADRKQEIIVGYDKLEDKDVSCLIIAKRIDEHIVVQEVFCGKDADVANRAVKMFKGNYIYKKEGYSNYEKE